MSFRTAAALALLLACYGKSTQNVRTESIPEERGPDYPAAELPPFEPAPLRVRTLLSWQYRNAIADLLGPEAAAVVTPPADTSVNGLAAIGASQLSLSTGAVSQYEQSAHAAVEKAFADPARRAAIVGCTPVGAVDASCFESMVRSFGRRAFRRPLEPEEVAAWTSVARQAAEAYGDFHRGAAFALAGILQSPSFLYQVELGAPDPDHPGRLRLDGYELASRLSFFLTGSIPSDALLDAAEAGELDTPEGLSHHARVLLETPRARAALRAFFDELLQLQDLPSLSKSPTAYPTWSPALAKAMREETLRLLEEAAFDSYGDFRAVLDARHTFVDRELAAHYGVALSEAATGWQRIELPADQPRAGILTHGSFLSLMAHPLSTSPTHRGKFIRERLLCEPVAAAPNNVDTSLSPTDPAKPQTMREKISVHLSNASCANCHRLMDPIGLGFEHFDAVGRYRTTEVGKPIDASGDFDGLGRFQDARGLAALLKQDVRASKCLARSLFRQASGHVDTLGEERPMAELHQAFERSGFKMKELLVAIAASDAFRYAATGGAP